MSKERTESEIIQEILAKCDHAGSTIKAIINGLPDGVAVDFGDPIKTLREMRRLITGELAEKQRGKDTHSRLLHRQLTTTQAQLTAANRDLGDKVDDCLAKQDEIARLQGKIVELGGDWV